MNAKFVHLISLVLAGAVFLSCQREDATSSDDQDGIRPIAVRLVRTAEVDDYTWFQTDSVKMVAKTTSGTVLLDKTLPFTNGTLTFGKVSAPGDQGVQVSATGYHKGRVIWTGSSDLPPSASEQTATLQIGTATVVSSGVVSAPTVFSQSPPYWTKDPDSVKVYDRPTVVFLKDQEDSAEYHYALDGSTPTSKSRAYKLDSGIVVDSTCKLRVIGLKAGWTASAITSESFRFRAKRVSHDTLSVQPWASSDTFDQVVTVKLGSETPNAEIRYTLDGSIPTPSSSLYATAGVVIDSTRTLTAVAFAGKAQRSDTIFTRSFVLRARNVTDSLSIQPWSGPDTFDRAVTVKLKSATPDAEIRYTLDGSTPTRTSSLYAGTGVVIDSTRTLMAVVFAGKAQRSEMVYKRSFVMHAQPAAIESMSIDPWLGTNTFDNSVIVKFKLATPDAEIRYTLDGSVPTRSSTLYASTGVVIDSTCTLNAVGYAGKVARSTEMLTRSFVMKARILAIESISAPAWAAPDTFDQPITVKLASQTSGAVIRYTLDGTAPTLASRIYDSAGILIDTNLTLNAMVFMGKQPGGILLTRTFAFKAQPAMVSGLSVQPWAAPDTFDQPVTVRLGSKTPNAEIRYTLDGSMPTRTSSLYASTGAMIDTNCTLKAVVFAGKAQVGEGVLTRTYSFKARPPTVLSLSVPAWASPDTFDRAVTVKLWTETPNEEIRYTLDGSAPTRASSLYSQATGIVIDADCSLRAVVYAGKSTGSDSMRTQTFAMKAQPVRFSVGTGLTTFGVVMSCPTPGVAIRYTKDGTTPTATSSLYVDADGLAFDQEDSVTIQAIAISTSGKMKASVGASVRIGPARGSFVDSRDGQKYKKVKIGSRIWMAENLNYKAGDVDSGWSFYNDPDSAKKYGRLYTWATAMSLPDSCNRNVCAILLISRKEGICPAGWHVPNDDEWTGLVDSAGGESAAKLKLRSKSGWASSWNGTDNYGFSMQPGGIRQTNGAFTGAGGFAFFWSSTWYDALNAWDHVWIGGGTGSSREHETKSDGFSLRCVED